MRLSKFTRKFFTNPNYADYWSTRVRTKRYEEAYRTDFLQDLRVSNGDLVLEIGVGEGRNASELLSEGTSYVGLDISRKMLGKARERIGREFIGKADLLVGDALWLPFRPDCFDKSLCFATMFFVPGQRRAISEILSVSRSRVGIEFRNSLNPRIFLYTMTVTVVNLIQPLLRVLLRTKPFRIILLVTLGRDRAERFSSQILVYDSLQPVFPITVSQIRKEIRKNGWRVESLEVGPMIDSDKSNNNRTKQLRSGTFGPVILVHTISEHDQNRPENENL